MRTPLYKEIYQTLGEFENFSYLRYCWGFSVTLCIFDCNFDSQLSNIKFPFQISFFLHIISLSFYFSNDSESFFDIRAKGEEIELQEVSNKFRISNYRFQNWFYFKLFSVFCWVLGCGSKTFRLAVNPRYLIP